MSHWNYRIIKNFDVKMDKTFYSMACMRSITATATQVLAALDTKLEEERRAGNANLARKIEAQIEKFEGAGYVEARR